MINIVVLNILVTAPNYYCIRITEFVLFAMILHVSSSSSFLFVLFLLLFRSSLFFVFFFVPLSSFFFFFFFFSSSSSSFFFLHSAFLFFIIILHSSLPCYCFLGLFASSEFSDCSVFLLRLFSLVLGHFRSCFSHSETALLKKNK